MSSAIWVGVERGACERLMTMLPQATLIDPSREDCPALNLLHAYRVDDGEREALAGAFLAVVEAENRRAWGPNLADAIYIATIATLEWAAAQSIEATAPDVADFLSDESRRAAMLAWLPDGDDTARSLPDQKSLVHAGRKVRRLLISTRMRRLLATPGGIDLTRDVFERQDAALICCYDLGDLGARTAGSLASLTCSAILHAGYRRTQGSAPVYVFADEFQLYASGVQEQMLTQLRRYGIGLTVACQGLWQLSEGVRDAVVQTGSLTCYRLHPKDAQYVGKWWQIEPERLTNLRTATALRRELRAGKPSAIEVVTHDPADPARLPDHRHSAPFWVRIADGLAGAILAGCDVAARMPGAALAARASLVSQGAPAGRPDLLHDRRPLVATEMAPSADGRHRDAHAANGVSPREPPARKARDNCGRADALRRGRRYRARARAARPPRPAQDPAVPRVVSERRMDGAWDTIPGADDRV